MEQEFFAVFPNTQTLPGITNHTQTNFNFMDGCATLDMYMYMELTTPTLQIRRQERKRVYFGTRENQIQVDARHSSDPFTSYLIGGEKKASETHTIAMLINTTIVLKPIYLYTCIYLYPIIQRSFHTGPCQRNTQILSLPCSPHVLDIHYCPRIFCGLTCQYHQYSISDSCCYHTFRFITCAPRSGEIYMYVSDNSTVEFMLVYL